MSVFLDHLAATLVGTTVLVVLAALMMAGGSDQTTQALHDIHKEQARGLATVLEDDLRNAGSGVPHGQAALLVAQDDAIRFRLKQDFGAAPLQTVGYLRVPTGTTRVGTTDVPTFAVERSVDGAVRQRYEGLTEFSVQLRDADSAPTTVLADGRRVHVTFAIGLPPAQAGGLDARARYRRSVEMPNLTP